MEYVHFLLKPMVKNHLMSLGMPETATADEAKVFAKSCIANGTTTRDKVAELKAKQDLSDAGINSGTTPMLTGSHKAADVFGGNGGESHEPRIRVKGPAEAFSTKRYTGTHVKTGEPVHDEQGRIIERASEQELALLGAWYKHLARRSGLQVRMDERDIGLVESLFQPEVKWVGTLNAQHHDCLGGDLVKKALLSDSVSGGLEINPIVFDDMIVTFPLLHSELLPFIDLKPLPRGSQVEAASIGNPTVHWGVPEGTAIEPFDTDDLIAGINSTIYPVAGAVEMGRDLLSDSPVAVGRFIEENIGQSLMAELDYVIVLGDGTSQPEGIFNASGVGTVSPSGTSAAPTVGELEALPFAIGKQYRNAAGRCAYISNDTQYARARSIPVDSSNDQRRIFGMDHQSYELLDWPYKIQNDISNLKVMFGALAKYRLYRRGGHESRFITEDRNLALANKIMLIVRGRYGGKVVDASAFAKLTYVS